MNSNLLKFNRKNLITYSSSEPFRLTPEISGSTIVLNTTNNDITIEIPKVSNSQGLFYKIIISEINSSNKITFFGAKDNDGLNPEEKLKVKNKTLTYSSYEINTDTAVRNWVGENIKLESDGIFWYLTNISFNETVSNATLVNNSLNSVILATGDEKIVSGVLNSGLTFDGNKLSVGGDLILTEAIESSRGTINVGNNYINSSNQIYSNNIKSSIFSENIWEQYGNSLFGDEADYFGWKTSISANGRIIAVGTPFTDILGEVKVYRWNDTIWTQMGSSIRGEYIYKDSSWCIDLSSDGETLVVTTTKSSSSGFIENGSFMVYIWTGTDWRPVASRVNGKSNNERLGHKCVINAMGNIVAVSVRSGGISVGDEGGGGVGGGGGGGGGAPGGDPELLIPPGTVRIYELSNFWRQMGTDLEGENNGDFFGCSLAINGNGRIIAVGAQFNDDADSNAGHVKVYKWNGTTWGQLGTNLNGSSENDEFGNSVALSFNGLVLAVGAIQAEEVDAVKTKKGYVCVYDFDGTEWIKRGSSIVGDAVGDNFGSDVALSYDGNIVAASAIKHNNRAGQIKVFEYIGDWVQKGNDIDGDFFDVADPTLDDYFDELGSSIGMSSDGKVIVGGGIQNRTEDYSKIGAGKVSVFYLEENLNNIAVNNLRITPSTAEIEEELTYNIDFSEINNVIYTVTFGAANLELLSSNATNVGQQGIIVFKLTNTTKSLAWKAGNGWYVNNSTITPTNDAVVKYYFFKYFIFESGKIAIMETDELVARN